MAEQTDYTSKMAGGGGSDPATTPIVIVHSSLSEPLSQTDYDTCVANITVAPVFLIYSSGGTVCARLTRINTSGMLYFTSAYDNVAVSVSVNPGATHTMTATSYTLS